MGNFVSTYVKFLQNFFTPKLLKSAEFWLNYSPENKGWRFLGDSVLAEVKPTGFPATSMSVCSGGKSFVDAHLLHGDVGSRTWLSAVAAARLISLVDALIALHLQPGVRPGTAYLPGTQEALCAADDVRAPTIYPDRPCSKCPRSAALCDPQIRTPVDRTISEPLSSLSRSAVFAQRSRLYAQLSYVRRPMLTTTLQQRRRWKCRTWKSTPEYAIDCCSACS